MLSHHNLYFTPPALWRQGEEKRKKINQNDIWLVNPEVKASHVENRPGTVLWVQKIGWASSSLGCNYLSKTKQNKKKCTRTYSPRNRYLSNLGTTHIQLCNVRVNCFSCGLCSFSKLPNSDGAHAIAQTYSRDTRNASEDSAHFSRPTATSLAQATIFSYSSICSEYYNSLSTPSICCWSYKPYKLDPMPLQILQLFFMTLRIKFKFL